MANTIKYSTSPQTLALKKGDYWIGTGDVGKGPTSGTDYWHGITPLVNGYTVYVNKASQGPSIRVAKNDTELIRITNQIAAQSYTSVTQCFNYFQTQSDKMVVQRDYESIVTDGLVLNLDAGFLPSYPQNGSSWYDLSSEGNNGTLVNGVGYDSGSGGNLTFDGVNDAVQLGNASNIIGSFQSEITVNTWLKSNVVNVYKKIITSTTSGANTIQGIYLSIGPSPFNLYLGIQTNVSRKFAAYTTNISTSDYSNICGTYDGSYIRLYLNGTQVAITSHSGYIGNGGIMRISGYDNGTEIWDGNISNLSIYNRALSSDEIAQNYNAQKDRFLSPVLLSMQNVSGNQKFYRYDVDANTFNLISSPTFTITSGQGPVTAATSKNNPNFLVSCVNHANTNQPVVIYSTNRGVSWSSLTYGRYWFGSCVSEDGNFAIAFLSGTDRKHYYTTNGGSSWTLGSGPFIASGSYNRLPWCNYDGSLIIIPTTVSTIYFWHNNRGTLVGKSTPTNHMTAFAPANAVYGGSFRVWYGPNTSSTGIYYSDDWGNNWTLKVIDAGFSAIWTNLAGSSDGVNMYAARDNGTNTKLYHSSDSGDTWTEITPAGSTRFNIYHPFICDWSGRFLYIGEGNSTTIHYSDDFGQNWTTLTSPVSGSAFNRTINFVNSI